MNIDRIDLQQFRNYSHESVQFSPSINVLIGQNGQGKTNILEAIYYLSTGKSYRVHREKELIQWGKKNFLIRGLFTIKERTVELESEYRDQQKMIRINGLPCRKLSNFVGTVNIVFFSPDDLILVKGGPAERRRFLDMHIAQMRPTYISLLNQYNKTLQQKSALLKSNQKQNILSQVSLWNEQLIPLGIKIMTLRTEYALKLQKKAETIFRNLSGQKEIINISYCALGQKELEQAVRIYPQRLEEKMSQEIERQMILVGPHRDDLMIEFNQHSGRLYGSQGQQRSLVLSMKLAELELMFEQNGEYPILLLDDVLSELDGYRRDYLMEFVRSSTNQTLITMTGAEKSVIDAGSSVFSVESGSIRREK